VFVLTGTNLNDDLGFFRIKSLYYLYDKYDDDHPS